MTHRIQLDLGHPDHFFQMSNENFKFQSKALEASAFLLQEERWLCPYVRCYVACEETVVNGLHTQVIVSSSWCLWRHSVTQSEDSLTYGWAQAGLLLETKIFLKHIQKCRCSQGENWACPCKVIYWKQNAVLCEPHEFPRLQYLVLVWLRKKMGHIAACRKGLLSDPVRTLTLVHSQDTGQ